MGLQYGPLTPFVIFLLGRFAFAATETDHVFSPVLMKRNEKCGAGGGAVWNVRRLV